MTDEILSLLPRTQLNVLRDQAWRFHVFMTRKKKGEGGLLGTAYSAILVPKQVRRTSVSEAFDCSWEDLPTTFYGFIHNEGSQRYSYNARKLKKMRIAKAVWFLDIASTSALDDFRHVATRYSSNEDLLQPP